MTALRIRTVCNSDAEANRRADMGMVMIGKSIGGRGDDSLTPTTVVGNYFSERELKEEFAELVAGYTALQLSKASGAGIDAAKKWLAGKALPNTANTFNMSQRLRVVNEWVAKRGGIRTGGSAQIAALREIVGEEVRALVKRPPAPSAEPEHDPRAAVRDLFDRRRA